MTARWPRATTLDGFFDTLQCHALGEGPLTRWGLVRATAAAVRLAWEAGGAQALDGLPPSVSLAGGPPRPTVIEDAEPALAQVEWWASGATGSDLHGARDTTRVLAAAARGGYLAAAEALGDEDPGEDRARLDRWRSGPGAAPAVAYWQVEALSELVLLALRAAGGGDDVTGIDVRNAYHACRAAGLVLYGLGERERRGRRWASEDRVLVAMRAASRPAPGHPLGRFLRGDGRARAKLSRP